MFVMLRSTTYLLVFVGVLAIQPNLRTSANRISRETKVNDRDESDDLAVRKFDIRPPQKSIIYFPGDEQYKNEMKRIGNNQ